MKRLMIAFAILALPMVASAGYAEEPASKVAESVEAPKQFLIDEQTLNQIMTLLNSPAALQGITTMQAAMLIQRIQQSAKPAPVADPKPKEKTKPKKE